MGPGLFQRVHTQAVYQVVHRDGEINGGYAVKACRPVTFCRIVRIIEAFKKQTNKKQNKKQNKTQLLQISGSGSNLSIYFPFSLDFFRSMACLSVSDVYRERRIKQ